MPRIDNVKLLSALLLALGAHQLSATVTYYVGSCKTGSFDTITAALKASPPPNVVKVCPGRYGEQVRITQAVTLEGMSSDNSADVVIVSPPNGLTVNAADDMGTPIAAQVYVDPISGFFIGGITLDANHNEVKGAYVVGIFVQNSAGTIDHVVTQNQIGGDGGVGIWIEAGANNSSVTVENSSIHDFSSIGIWTQMHNASDPTAVEHNFVNGKTSSGLMAIADVALGDGSTSTVSDNYLAGGRTGISISGGATSTVADNNLINDGTAIVIAGDGATGGNISVTSNDIFSSSVKGIVVNSGLPVVQRNTITHVPIGIDFACSGDGSVKTNTIMDAGVGIDNVPAGFASSNSYFNVRTITGGSCGG